MQSMFELISSGRLVEDPGTFFPIRVHEAISVVNTTGEYSVFVADSGVCGGTQACSLWSLITHKIDRWSAVYLHSITFRRQCTATQLQKSQNKSSLR